MRKSLPEMCVIQLESAYDNAQEVNLIMELTSMAFAIV